MSDYHIVRQINIPESFRVSQIRGMFDYSNTMVKHEWSGKFPIKENDWKVGLIVGPSGSGKTTLSKELFQDMAFHTNFDWPTDKAVIDGFSPDIETKQIVKTLNAVGFSSPPSWLKPFNVLSNGQKFRVELARSLMEYKQGVVFDEFTSVVDRDVAKIGCVAVSKFLRKQEMPPFVAVSCHYDIIDWLEPDWVFDVSTSRFDWRRRRRSKQISINIYKTTVDSWRVFREHHYLTHDIHRASECFLATWNDKPVAFCSVLHFPHPRCKKFKREHRTVVLPDFQGVGIGNRLSEFVAELYVKKGYRFISTTSAPAMIMHRHKSQKWRTHRFGFSAKPGPRVNKSLKSQFRTNCISAGFEFIGK